MTWATDRRLDYIDWRLGRRGEVHRGDLIRVFGVSPSQASADLASFLRAYRGAMRYDRRAKRYVPREQPYASRRGMDDPAVRRAISLLARASHPMGWSD